MGDPRPQVVRYGGGRRRLRCGYGVTDPENPNPYGRASMIIVPIDAEGFERIENTSVHRCPPSVPGETKLAKLESGQFSLNRHV